MEEQPEVEQQDRQEQQATNWPAIKAAGLWLKK
jgi:hypothetical protein